MAAVRKSPLRVEAKRAPAILRLPARLLAPFMRRPVEGAGCAVFAALMTGILLNALALQNARHPSPLFGKPLVLTPSAAPAEAPKPVPRPASISAAPGATQSAPPTVIAARPVAAARDAEPAAAKAPDAIGEMLRGAPANSPNVSSANPSAIEATRILLVQKALMKLGYIVRPDGVIGATTRQAIEKFERDRGWTAHGELTPKILREISARSGLSLE